MEKNVKKPEKATAAAKPAAVAKPSSAPAKKKPANASSKATSAVNKILIESSLKVAEKSTTSVCDEIKKKILNHKSATSPEITNVNGIDKNALMRIIETLDSMGGTTYRTACSLRELHDKMK